jgi:hypothetical protein
MISPTSAPTVAMLSKAYGYLQDRCTPSRKEKNERNLTKEP